MNIERAIEVLKWPDTGAGPCPSMSESAEAGRIGAAALEALHSTKNGMGVSVLPRALRAVVMEQRIGVYTPGQRAVMSASADLLDDFAQIAAPQTCEEDIRPVFYPDEELNRRSGLLEDD